MKQVMSFTVNGESYELLVDTRRTLLEVLRDEMGLTGTKEGCSLGACGTCTVILDGKPVLSCLVLPVDVEGQDILTIEGVALGHTPHPLQTAFSELGAAQCGYCTPGILLTALALLQNQPHPDRDQIKQALAGNLCRCTGYIKILQAVELAAQRSTA